jgi:hypothetical protein
VKYPRVYSNQPSSEWGFMVTLQDFNFNTAEGSAEGWMEAYSGI